MSVREAGDPTVAHPVHRRVGASTAARLTMLPLRMMTTWTPRAVAVAAGALGHGMATACQCHRYPLIKLEAVAAPKADVGASISSTNTNIARKKRRRRRRTTVLHAAIPTITTAA